MLQFLKSIKQVSLAICLFSMCNLEAKWSGVDRISTANTEVVNDMDGSGNATAMWTEWYARKNGIYSSDLPKSSNEYWGRVDTVYSAEKRLFRSLNIAVDSSWNSIALWEEYDGSNVKVSASTRTFQGDWSVPVDLSSASILETFPQLAISADGFAVAVWVFEGVVKAATLQFGGTWSPAVDISTSLSLYAPKVKIDGLGNAVVVWISGGDVLSSSLPHGGEWSAPVIVSKGNSREVQLEINRSGFAVASWGEGSAVSAATAQFGQPWSAPVQFISVPKDDNFFISPNVKYVQVAVDSQGNGLVGWERQDWDGSKDFPILTPNYIQASYFSSGHWSCPAMISSGGDSNLRLKFDGAGNAFAIWNTYSAIQSATLPFQGEWTPVATIEEASLGLNSRPQISVDSTGYAVVTWSDEYGMIKGAKWTPESSN